jgi:lipopolysaccharide transport system ATP-binding protein
MDAIVIQNVSKHFRRSTIGREYSTFKTELVRMFTRRKKRAITSATAIQALHDISFRVPQGKTVGLLGRNGSGKSTLLKLITGIYTPSSGSIHVNGRISALLDLGAGFHPDFSGRENVLINGIILGLTRAQVRDRMDEIIEFSELGDFIDEPVRTYSSGMFMRLAFSVAVNVDPEILIIDEILAVGDAHFSRKSRARMEDFKRQGKTILLVSHDLGVVESWCDTAVWLDGGRLREMGESRTLVRHYMEEINAGEARAAAEAPKTLLAAPTASAPFEISSARWLSDSGDVKSSLSATEPATLELVLSHPPAMGNLHLKVVLRRDIGLVVWEGVTALPKDAEQVQLSFEKLPLANGGYDVNVAVLMGTEVVRVIDNVTSFTMQTPGAAEGVVCLEHSWRFGPDDLRAMRVVQGT